jgi:cysteine desulfurase
VELFFHSTAQATGKVVIDLVNPSRFDEFCAHKTYNKGIGALFVRRKTPSEIRSAKCTVVGHERGFRSGTLATHQIVGMGEAFRLARLEMAAENERIRMLRDRLPDGIKGMEEIYVNGDLEHRVPYNP